MNVDDLSPEHRQAYYLQCASPHSVEVSVDLENTDGEVLVSFDQGRGGGRGVEVTGGEVQVDADTPTGRVLTLPVEDHSQELLVAQEANYVDRMLHAKVGVPCPAIGKTIWRTVFQGPIVLAPRAGDVVTFTAHGKARYGLHGIRTLYVIPKGTKITTAIRLLLHDLCGEPYSTMGGIPDLPAKLAEDLLLHIQSQPFVEAQKLAASINYHLHYAGDGDKGMKPAMTRTDSTHVAYTFHSAKDQPGLVGPTPPESSTDILGTLKNALKLTGGATKTTKAPVGFFYADGSAFSPAKLGRNDSDACFWDERTIPALHTQAGIDRVGPKILARDLVGDREVKWESMPFYAFDEYDLLKIDTSEVTAFAHWRQGTIPLDVDGAPSQSYGYHRRAVIRPFAGRR